jgi:uncharacterized membrane protein
MHLLLSTIALRPYVYVFLVSFLFISIVNFGLRTTALFALLTYLVAFVCELSSIRIGFPFGLYHYIEATRGRELWVFGVPFMDSISFTFLAFASYSVAILVSSPLYRQGGELRTLDTWEVRGSLRVLLMAALFMVMVDMVVDPLSVLGDRWFLGKIYWYDPPGVYFGVPISNFMGWYFIAAVSIAIFQRLDWWSNHDGSKPLGVVPGLFCRSLLGPLLYAGIACFGITMLFVIRAPEIGFAAVFIFLPMLVLTIHILTRPDSYGGEAAIARHLADFPYDNVIFEPKLVAETAAVRRRA